MKREPQSGLIDGIQVIKPSKPFWLFISAAPALIFILGFAQWVGLRSGLPQEGLKGMMWALFLGVPLHWLATNTRIYLSEDGVVYRKRHWLFPSEIRIRFSEVEKTVRVQTRQWGQGPWDHLEVTYDDSGTPRKAQVTLVPFTRDDVHRVVTAFASRTPYSAVWRD